MKQKVKLNLLKKKHIVAGIVIGLLLLCTLFSLYLNSRKKEILSINEKKIGSIALLQANQIELWMQHLLKDARYLIRHPQLREAIHPTLKTESPQDKKSISLLLEQIRRGQEFYEIILSNTNGDLIASSNQNTIKLHDVELSTLRSIEVSSGSAITTDFFNLHYKSKEKIQASMILPYSYDPDSNHMFIIFRIGLSTILHPVLKEFPYASVTAESCLFTVHNDSISLLTGSDQPLQSNLYLRKVKANQLELPAYKGQVGLTSGKDYNGKKVIAYSVKINLTPWIFIHKTAVSEIYKEVLKVVAVSIGGFVIYLLLVVVAIVTLFNSRQRNIYKELLIKALKIDEQKNIIQETESRYKEFFNQDLTGDYYCTAEGKLIDCNPAFSKILGFGSPEDLIGRNVVDFYKNPAEHQQFLDLIQKEKNLKEFEITLQNVEGNEIICLENVVGRFDENNNLTDYFGYIYDITQKKNNENELLNKNQLLSSVMETQQELICRFLPDTTLTFVNKAYGNFFGKSEMELVGKKFLTLVPPSDWVLIQAELKGLTIDNPRVTYISNAIKPDGSVAVMQWTDIAIFNEFDEITEYQSVGIDITEKLKKDEDMFFLLKMNEILRKIASGYINLPIRETNAFIQRSLEDLGKFIKADRVYVFEYDWILHNCSNTFEWCDSETDPQIDELQNVSLDDIPQWWKPHKKGEILIIEDVNELDESDVVRQILEPQNVKSLITFPIMNNNGCIGFVGFDYVRNQYKVTEREKELLVVYTEMLSSIYSRTQLEKDLLHAKEKAEESDRLKSAFISNISHEIRTPLNGILGFGKIIAEEDLDSEVRKEMVSYVQLSAKRLMDTITDYMDIARIFSGTMQLNNKSFQLQPFMQNILEETKLLYSRQEIELEFSFPPETGKLEIISNPDFLRKILNKLIDNAFKFTKKGKVRCGYRLINGVVEFFVEDTGIGIEENKLTTIFKMFNQVETSMARNYEGSGLGLSIARGLVNLLGGTINVHSEMGKGSVFTFSVPYDILK